MLWIDSAADEFNEKLQKIPDIYKQNILELRDLGYTIIKNVNNHAICDNFVKDFENYSDFKNRDSEYYNNKRWIAGHSLSDATKNVTCNEKVLKLLDCIFETETVVYSSLIFWKGTQQGVHRDTPHFYTNPVDHYFGCWHALEDIHPDSGPLFYYEGGHKLTIPSGKDIYNEVLKEINEEDTKATLVGVSEKLTPGFSNDMNDINFKCLVKYCDQEIASACKKLDSEGNKYKTAIINKGDCIIWHPKLPHGGSKINNNFLYRRSCVTHCVPIYKAVAASKQFFNDTYEDSDEYKDYFDYKNYCYNIAPNGRKYISCSGLEGKPMIQTTYS
jgi:ectoine hydroxylase-related dioxygenase (phytanoyl-CoA dioxygenase family)